MYIRYLLILFLILVLPLESISQLVNVKGNSTIFLSQGAVFQINGGIRVDNTSSLVHQNGAISNLYISGKFEIYGTYTQNSDGRITFNKGLIDTISGNSSITLARIYIDKSNNNRVVLDPTTTLTITQYLYLLNSSLEIVNSDLLLNAWAKIYSSLSNDTTLSSFNSNKCIINSGSSSNVLLGGHIVRKFPNTLSLPQMFQFPIGTPGYYSPAEIELRASGATFGSNPEISIKPVDKEHPQVEVNNKSLTKYWVVNSNDININGSGANVFFHYNAGEVNGNEAAYDVLYFSPSYNNPLGYWRLDPGNDNDIVDFNQRFFYSIKVDSIKGDWSAGEPEVSSAIYYSRQNGDWDDPNTWSKVNFGGVASNTIPNKQSDKIRIKGNTITIDAQPASFRSLSLEKDATISKLIIQGNYYLTGDSTIVQDSTYLSFAHQDGIAPVPTMSGCIRTNLRTLSSNATYEFSGSGNQNSGTGIPNIVKSLVVNKNSLIDTVTIQKNISIGNSLNINQGTIDVSSFALNGAVAGRAITMNGGELILRASFLTNYNAPSFYFGKVTFAGTGNTIVPSSTSIPAVNQYNNLKIAGNNRSGNITFPNIGLINIKDSLDIASLSFTNNSYKFLTDGSTVVFNKNGGSQYIPLKPLAPSDSVVYLEYFNLILDSAGSKLLHSTGSPTFKVRKNLTLRNSSNFNTNNFNLEVQGKWTNESGATFTAGNSTVIMRSTVAMVTETISSRDTTDNTFNNLLIAGPGIINALDNIKVIGNLRIDTLSTFSLSSNQLSLYGDFIVNGGTHQFATSTVKLSNNITQNIISSSSDVPFYNLVIDNPQDVVATSIGGVNNGLIINNNLDLNSGNLIVHAGSTYRYAKLLNNLTRIGGGYVDGELRKRVPINTASITYEVGHLKSYTPITLDFIGTGGTEGYLGILSDTLGVSSTPIQWTDAIPSDITPAGSTINMLKHVARQIGIIKPLSSTFALGTTREYNITATYIPGASPNGDIRNSADYNNFVGRIWNGSNWISPFYYGSKPVIGSLTPTTFQYSQLKDLGTLIFGEPGLITYYTRASGNWDDINNWSTQGYGGIVATSYPSQLSNNFKAYIGNNNNINLNLNITADNISGDSSLVQVDSTGTLMLQDYIISGSGAFRLMKNSVVGIGNSNGIVNAPTNSGNIRTGTRNYNFSSHNLGTFVYTGIGSQNTGNGLPSNLDSILKLVVDKPSGTLTLNSSNNIYVKDSLYIKLGDFNLGSIDVYCFRNIRKGSGASLVPNGRTVYLRGDSSIYITSDNYNELVNFYNLNILKAYNTGDIILNPLTTLNISNNLTFAANNKAKIDATSNSSEAQPLFVQFGNSASVNGAGNINFIESGGWVYGEVRKNIPSGNAPDVQFETGTQLYYSPFSIDFATGSGTAGYLSGNAINGNHPKLYSDPPSLYPISPSRNITVYWRLKKPANSTFDRGNRNADFTVYFANPEQQINTDCFGCADLTFFRGGDSLSWWQRMPRNSTYDNSGLNNVCGDTRLNIGTPTFNYNGDPCGSNASLGRIKVLSVPSTYPLGSTDYYANGDTLLADFVAGNRNTLKYYKFYSIKDGNWSDPTTWSTESYSGTINAAASDLDPQIRPIPSRQYDNVYIGNGKKVTLDVNIGSNSYSSGSFASPFVGPSVFVENTGTLDFGTSVLRGNQFNAKSGSTLIIGSNDGIINTNTGSLTGNVQMFYNGYPPGYSDSINFVYAPNGRTSNGSSRPTINRNSTINYIESITIKKVSDNSIVMQYISGDKFLLTQSGHVRSLASCSLNVGEQYYIEINPSNVANNRKYKVWADWDFNGTFNNSGSEFLSNNNSNDTILVTTTSFTVPATNDQGSVQLRIGMGGNTGDFNSDASNTDANTSGEFEDYTIHIKNTNYAANQVSGAGLPSLLQSLTIHSPNVATANPQFTLGKSIAVIDNIYIKSGTFNQASNDINLYGNFINDTLNGFVAGNTNPLRFVGLDTQSVSGTNAVKFNNVEVNKPNNTPVNLNTNIIINGNLSLNSNNNLILNPNNTLRFTNTGIISPGAGSFSSDRMVRTDGISNISKITKEFFESNYCIPSLRWGNTSDSYINNVTYSSLNNASGKSGFSDFTSLTPPNIIAGTPTNINITQSGASNRRWYLWIDADRNGVFENNASERLINGTNSTSINQNITIPTSAYNGVTRMRIKMRNGGNSDPCESSTSTEGEYEDYLVNISNGTVQTNQVFTFNFPVGTDSIYNPAYIDLLATQTAEPTISLLLKKGKHPNRITESILGKYWVMSSTGIENIKADTLLFTYAPSDTNGNGQSYIPSRYVSPAWEINLGATPKSINNQITIRPTNIDSLQKIDGEWTAGAPFTFFYGRKFYSINNGDWNVPANWSNVGHNGPRSQYFPGDIYYKDTVMIDGHTITFKDSSNISIDSLRIGGTNINPGQGRLLFGVTPNNKSLTLRQIFTDEDGMIDGTAGTRQDTIIISENFSNNSTASLGFRNDLTSATHLKFVDTSNSHLYGSGNFGRLGNLILEKIGGLNDTLFIESSNFALASDTTMDYTINFHSGFLAHNVNSNLYLSSGANMINMEQNTGIGVFNGSVRSNASVISNFNTNFQIDGGDFIIGNAPDDNFLYKTGTTFNVINGNVTIAGVFGRALTTSLIEFNMTGNNVFKVLTMGNTDNSKIGFDISNSASSFSMSNGRIIIANGGGSTPSSADYNVSTQNGTGMIAGVLQSGDSTLTPANTIIKIAGSSPVYDLHFANNLANNVDSKVTESIFTINNNWTIDANHSFNLDGNTVRLAGNLINYGDFTAVPSGATSNEWQIELNGLSDQTLFSDLNPFEMYKLAINKPSGNVLLSPSGISNLIIRNSLEFTSSNNAFINSAATGRFVELSPTPHSDPVVYRIGLGHIYGRLYRYIPAGNAVVDFPVGADTITSYRPAKFSTIGTGGTAGLIGVQHFPIAHPDTISAPFIAYKSILKYWNVDDPSTFDLGTRTFDLRLQYLNPQDLNGSPSQLLDMYRYSPPVPSPGTWADLYSPYKSDTTVTSTNNVDFGDFTLGEPTGITYYSYNNGLWSDLNTWSLDGYTSKVLPVLRPPNEATDIVRIGNGKAVTLEDNFNDTLKSVIVERYNYLPGELYMNGTLNFIRGNSFILEDSCTLGIQHINGITPTAQGASGAIQTNSRNYGVARYIYNSPAGSTITGLGLPDSVKSIVIDMPNTVNKTVFLSNAASPTVKIQDSLTIKQGEFSTNTRYIAVNKVIELDTIINNGRIVPGSGKFIFPNINDKYIILKNRSGANFYDIDITNGNVIVKRPNAPLPDSSHIYVNNVLNFAGSNSKFEINDDVNLIMKNSSVNAIQNFSNQNFVRIGNNGGYLIRNIDPSVSYTFPIGLLDGINNEYNPVTFDGLTGTSGYLGARVDFGTGNNLAHVGASGIPSSSFIQKYWTIDSTTLQINGKLRFYYNDDDIYNTETEITKIGRWNPVKEGTPGSWTFPFSTSNYNYASNYFETTANFNYTGFKGDWAFGSENYYRRLFFSRQSGNWNDENTWTYNSSHIGPIFGTGMWPNFPDDSVTIGGGSNGLNNHIVVLNVDLPFSIANNVGIAVGTSSLNTGTLDFGVNNLNGNRFILRELSTIIIGSLNGITLIGDNSGNLRTTDTRNLSKNAKYHYRGINDQVTGAALPDTVNTLIVDNQGILNDNTLTLLNSSKVSDSLIVKTGRFDIGSLNNVNAASLTAHARVYPNAIIAMGGILNFLTAVNGYQDYNLEDLSYAEFYGNNQIISNLPLNFTQSFITNTGGFANIISTDAGTKYINSQLLMRNNLINRNTALLSINGPVISVRVLESVLNSASIYNEGIIEVGQ
ncbi:MAG TPA: GEVED domain-containing protein [Candidatus Kapabacteria bacterium]|nr:GEVED domain-containing protein [Candidatus Kapabacteria bacterium]